MNIIYSPWMNKFLQHVKSCEKEILLVSPFIKLSLIRPLLLVLPDRKISLTVVTRFNKLDFEASASDIEALELLKRRPGLSGLTRIFKLNRLHAKLYIFDMKTIFLGSSNLSISGLDRNFEMAVELSDPELASNIYSQLKARSIMLNELSDLDLEEMYSRLHAKPAVLDIVDSASLVEEVDTEEFEAAITATNVEESLPEVEPALDLQDIVIREKAIQEFLDQDKKSDLNSISGVPFDSPSMIGQDKVVLLEAARRDIDRIREVSIHSLGLEGLAIDPDAIVTPFVHRNWCDWLHGEIIAHGLQQQFFSELGKGVLQLEVALHFARQIAFDDSSAGQASKATHAIVPNLDYEGFLKNKKLFFLLHIDREHVIPKDIARIQFATILGIQCHYRGYKAVRHYLRPFLDEQIPSQIEREEIFDPKTLLQDFTQIEHIAPQYHTHQSGGTVHQPIFTSYVSIGTRKFDEATGDSTKKAELAAARAALAQIKSDPRNKDRFERAVRFSKSYTKRAPYVLNQRRREQCYEIAECLGDVFKRNLSFIDLALTHVSFVREHPSARSYERLAFVGSFIAEVILRTTTIREFGWHVPGIVKEEYSKRNHVLTSRVFTLMFDELNLKKYFRSNSEVVGNQEKVKADVIQSLLATAFLQGGIEACENFWTAYVESVLNKVISASTSIDGVTLLQEYTQKDGMTRPEYIFDKVPQTPVHKPIYIARCYIAGKLIAEGRGASQKKAKQEAARNALEKLRLG